MKILNYIFILLFLLFIILIKKFVIKEGNTSQLEQDRKNKILAMQNKLLEAEIRDKSIIESTKKLGNNLDALHRTILKTQNKADELQKQSDMAKERNHPNSIEYSNDLKNQEMKIRITLDDLINKYTNDNIIFQKSYADAQNAHTDFLLLQKELSNLTI